MLSVKNKNFLRLMTNLSWAGLAIASLYQVAFWSDVTNLRAVLCIVLVWLLFIQTFFTGRIIRNYPLSALLLFGFTFSQVYLPLIFTSIEGKPVTFNLTLPNEVFFHTFVEFIVLLLAHSLYRCFFKPTPRNASSLLYRAGFFTAPLDLQLWIMGFIGFAASYYVYFINPSIGREVSGSASDKFVQGLIAFLYAPFFIPVGKLYGDNKVLSKKLWIMLGMYSVLVFVIGIGRNSRGAFMMGFTSIAFAFLIGLITGIFRSNLFTGRNMLIVLASFWVITGPMADLGTAMVNVRNERNDVKATELIGLTLTAFQDKKAIRMRREEDMSNQTDWDERYLNNIFTARFSNLKFNDASLVQAEKIGEHNPAMLDYSIQHTLGTLPGPVLKAFNIEVDKEFVYNNSFGDYIYNLAGAGSEAFGGFRTGHFAGTGMAAFGWWYLLILGAGMIPVFLLIDKLVFIKKKIIDNKVKMTMRFSFCGLLALTTIFQFLPTESVVLIIAYLMRGWLQMALLYFIIFHFTRLLSGYLVRPGKKAIVRPT